MAEVLASATKPAKLTHLPRRPVAEPLRRGAASGERAVLGYCHCAVTPVPPLGFVLFSCLFPDAGPNSRPLPGNEVAHRRAGLRGVRRDPRGAPGNRRRRSRVRPRRLLKSHELWCQAQQREENWCWVCGSADLGPVARSFAMWATPLDLTSTYPAGARFRFFALAFHLNSQFKLGAASLCTSNIWNPPQGEAKCEAQRVAQWLVKFFVCGSVERIFLSCVLFHSLRFILNFLIRQ